VHTKIAMTKSGGLNESVDSGPTSNKKSVKMQKLPPNVQPLTIEDVFNQVSTVNASNLINLAPKVLLTPRSAGN
jgi:hypothetical protein